MSKARLTDKALILAIGSGIQALVQTAVGLVLVRVFDSQETFGSYRQVWLTLNTLTPILMLGLSQAIYYFLPGLPVDQHRAYMRRSFGLLAISGFVAAIGLFFGSTWIANLFSNPRIAPLIQAASFYPLFTIPAMALFHFLVTKGAHLRGVVLNLIFFLFQAALIIGLAVHGSSLMVIFRVIVIFASVRLIWSLVEVRNHTREAHSGRLDVSPRANLSYAIPVWLSLLTNTLGQQLDKLIVSSLLGVIRYATYSVGAIEFPGIPMVTTAANTVLRPHIAKLHHAGKPEEITSVWRSAFRKQALVALPMAVYLALFSNEFISLLYTVQYRAAALPFQIYLLLTFFRIAPPETILTSVGKTRAVFHGSIMFLVLNLGLSLLLVRPLDMAGPALATVIARAALAAFYAHRAAKLLGVPILILLPFRIAGRVILIASGAALCSMPVWLLHWDRFPTLALGAVIFGGVYVLLGGYTRTILREDWIIVRDWVRTLRRWPRRP